MTATLETIAAVVVYWWIALKVGVLWPLMIGAAAAPLVLLRSKPAVALGLKWFLRLTKHINDSARQDSQYLARLGLGIFTLLVAAVNFSIMITLNVPWFFVLPSFFLPLASEGVLHLPSIIGLDEIIEIYTIFGGVLYILSLSISIRLTASLLHPLSGIKALPRNFRQLIFCTSPVQLPELVPGLEESDSELRVFGFLQHFTRTTDVSDRIYVSIAALILFLPAWLYRITIKSTAWFWWPLAFLGGDLKRVQNPELFHWDVMGSLWAKASMRLTYLTLLAFVFANLVVDRVIFEQNPLLSPLGYLLLFDWKLRLWQICALLAASLSIVLVYRVDYVSGVYRIAQDKGDTELLEAAKYKYGWVERLSRLRLLVVLTFWGLIGTHTFLYANSSQGWCFTFHPKLEEWAQNIYSDRIPRSNECLLLP